MSRWKKLSSREIYKNPWIKLREDRIIQPNGEEGIYAFLEQPSGACVLPVDEKGKIWLFKKEHYIFGDITWDIVAGDVEDGEEPEDAARRELLEELGMNSDKIDYLGVFRPSEGRVNQETYVFLARDVEKVNTDRREALNEGIIESKSFELSEIEKMISKGEINCGYVMNALYFYKLYLDGKFV